jgi:3,4-dihydroxy 2-butanone 4-phosphate synthase / GTP cyclohydrolase II
MPDTTTGGPVVGRVGRAVAAIAANRPVVVVDDVDREDGGDLIFAAECATTALLAFMVRHTSGYVCVALPGDECDRLGLPPMHDRFGTDYCVTVDLIGSGTGISAADRARTIAALAAPGSLPSDFLRPGHVVPLRARDGGVLRRPGHPEAAVDLARLAGLRPAGVLCGIVSRDRPTEMAHGAELERFAGEYDLEIVSIAELVTHRRRTEPQVQRVADTALPTAQGTRRAIGYRGVHDGAEHLALVVGRLADGHDVPLHVHAECLTGDVLGSLACTCGSALDSALATMASVGRGIVVYVRTAASAHACGLLDRVDAGRRVTSGEVAAAILGDLGVTSVRLVEDVPGLREVLLGDGLLSNDAPMPGMDKAGRRIHDRQHRVQAGPESGMDQLEPTSLPTNPNPRHSVVAIADRSSSATSSPMTMGDNIPNAPQVKYRLSLANSTSASVEPKRIAATANTSAI